MRSAHPLPDLPGAVPASCTARTVWLRADVEAWIAEHRPPRPTEGDEAE